MRLAGYAALFDRRDAGGDTIRKGAFAASLASADRLPLYWQHRPDQRIGWVERAEEDDTGLRVIAMLDRPSSRAAHLLAQGAVNGLSFGYRARNFRTDGRGRELTELDVREVSLVTHPMQAGARVLFVSA